MAARTAAVVLLAGVLGIGGTAALVGRSGSDGSGGDVVASNVLKVRHETAGSPVGEPFPG